MTELIKPQENAVSLFGGYKADDDYADMRQNDFILPRLRLIQSQSAEAKPIKLGEPPKNQIGDWVNSATGNLLIGAGKATKIVFLSYWLEQMEWNPDRGAKNKIIRRSADPTSKEFKEMAALFERRVKVTGSDGKEKLKITEVFHFLTLLPEVTGNYDEMFLLSLSRTSHKKGREMLNKCRGFRYPGSPDPISPMFAAHWNISADVEVNERKEEYMVPSFPGSAEPVHVDWLPHLAELATKVRERRVQMREANSAVNEKQDSDDAAAAAAGDAEFR